MSWKITKKDPPELKKTLFGNTNIFAHTKKYSLPPTEGSQTPKTVNRKSSVNAARNSESNTFSQTLKNCWKAAIPHQWEKLKIDVTLSVFFAKDAVSKLLLATAGLRESVVH